MKPAFAASLLTCQRWARPPPSAAFSYRTTPCSCLPSGRLDQPDRADPEKQSSTDSAKITELDQQSRLCTLFRTNCTGLPTYSRNFSRCKTQDVHYIAVFYKLHIFRVTLAAVGCTHPMSALHACLQRLRLAPSPIAPTQ